MDGKPSSESVQLVATPLCPQFRCECKLTVLFNDLAWPKVESGSHSTVGGLNLRPASLRSASARARWRCGARGSLITLAFSRLRIVAGAVGAHAHQPDAAVGQVLQRRHADLPGARTDGGLHAALIERLTTRLIARAGGDESEGGIAIHGKSFLHVSGGSGSPSVTGCLRMKKSSDAVPDSSCGAQSHIGQPECRSLYRGTTVRANERLRTGRSARMGLPTVR